MCIICLFVDNFGYIIIILDFVLLLNVKFLKSYVNCYVLVKLIELLIFYLWRKVC